MRCIFMGMMLLYEDWTRRKKKLKMGEVEEEKRARDEEVEDVFTSKSASPKAGIQTGAASACALPCPARCASVVGPIGFLSASIGLLSCYCRGREVVPSWSTVD